MLFPTGLFKPDRSTAPRAMTSRSLLEFSKIRTMRTKRKTRIVEASCTLPQLAKKKGPFFEWLPNRGLVIWNPNIIQQYNI